ncbi:MAG: nrdR [Candidatus Saccharibacteria bacterium]|nr:nrdR [Candidatus Saccharibacteria bacterium]
MVCIQCGHETSVANSRHQKRSNQVWRRRKCQNCGCIFSTTETTNYSGSWRVLGNNGRLHPFSRDKLFISIYESLQHRRGAIHEADGLVTTVISKLSPHVKNGVIKSGDVVTVTQVALNRFDNVGSTHYQAFHGS